MSKTSQSESVVEIVAWSDNEVNLELFGGGHDHVRFGLRRKCRKKSGNPIFYRFSPERKVPSRTYAFDVSLIPSLYSSYKAKLSSTERFLPVFVASGLVFNEYHGYTLGSTPTHP
jgi:hypothetical protein